jgi:tetratricopeptide (TPR) repeat protein
VEGASGYTVRVFEQDNPNNKVKFLKELPPIAANQMPYPETSPALNKEGFAYMFSVTANTGASSLGDVGDCMGFKLLSDYERDKILKEESKIDKLSLARDERDLAKAYYYDREGLLGEAIETLETSVATPNRSSNPLIYHQLARFYAKAGLNQLADIRASQALDKYKSEKEKYNTARIQAELAVIKLMLGENLKAKNLAQEAKLIYQELGSATDVDQRMSDAKVELESAATTAKDRVSKSRCDRIKTPSK